MLWCVWVCVCVCVCGCWSQSTASRGVCVCACAKKQAFTSFVLVVCVVLCVVCVCVCVLSLEFELAWWCTWKLALNVVMCGCERRVHSVTTHRPDHLQPKNRFNTETTRTQATTKQPKAKRSCVRVSATLPLLLHPFVSPISGTIFALTPF